MKKLNLFFLIFTVAFAMVSCVKEETYIPSDISEARSEIYSFTQELDSTKSFSFILDNKGGYVNSLEDKNDISFSYQKKQMIQYNAETRVFAYYVKYQNQNGVDDEILGYIQYSMEHNSFIKTNSYTKTYTIEDYNSIEDFLHKFYKDEVGIYYFVYFFNIINSYKDSEITKSDTNNSMKFIKNGEDVTFSYQLDINNNNMIFSGESTNNNGLNYYIETFDYLLLIDDNDLRHLDISNYTLYPVV